MNYLIIKIINNIIHPLTFFSNVSFKLKKREFKKCGKNVIMGYNYIIKEPHNISFGENVFFGKNCRVLCYEEYNGKVTNYKPNLVFGNNISINESCSFFCMNNIKVSDGCLFGDNVSIFDNFHGKSDYSDLDIQPNLRELSSKGPVYIGKNVWIGKNVCIMPNVTIGDYAIIGANAVVTHDIPAYAVAVGVPAKVVKMMNQGLN